MIASLISVDGQQGGDLAKWNESGIGHYVGIDIADRSVEDAIVRYNDTKRWKCNFPTSWCVP